MLNVHHFTWNLLENMTNRFPHIPDFAWISHALPLIHSYPLLAQLALDLYTLLAFFDRSCPINILVEKNPP